MGMRSLILAWNCISLMAGPLSLLMCLFDACECINFSEMSV